MSTSTNCAGMLSSLTRQALAIHDTVAAEAFARIYIEPADASVENQIRAANDFWRVKLGVVCTPESRDAREALIECSLEDWIRLFHKHVAPVVPMINRELH